MSRYVTVVTIIEATTTFQIKPLLEEGREREAIQTYEAQIRPFMDTFPELWDMLSIDVARQLEVVRQLEADNEEESA